MIPKDSFTYGAAAADFPISIEVESFAQAANMSVISDGLVTLPADGSAITTFPLVLPLVTSKSLVKVCKIPDPSAAATPPAAKYPPLADVNLLFVFSYATGNAPNPRYEIRLKPAAGPTLIRSIHTPTSRDFVVIEYRSEAE